MHHHSEGRKHIAHISSALAFFTEPFKESSHLSFVKSTDIRIIGYIVGKHLATINIAVK